MQVALCGRDGAMPEEELDFADVHACGEQMGGQAVPEDVRGEAAAAGGDSYLLAAAVKDLAHGAAGQGSAPEESPGGPGGEPDAD
jgi:hypothetical protein